MEELLYGGLRFDLTAILYLSSLYLVMMWLPLPMEWRTDPRYQKVAKWVLWVPNILGIICNGIDTVYIRFTDRRTNMTFFTEFQHEDNLASIFFTSVAQYWYVSLCYIAIIALFILLTRYNKHIHYTRWSHRVRYYVLNSLLFIVSGYFTVIGIRGGFGDYTRPITLSNALQYTDQPRETMIVLNTPFSLMRSSDSETFHRMRYYDEQKAEQIMSPEHLATHRSTPEEKMNVVVIILESFSKEYIGFFHRDWHEGTYQGYTPFLDSLLAHSITYTHSYASGRKSIDAMPSILSSIPMLIEPYIVTPYSTNAISSIADCLKQKGYTTSFFHGAPNGSMGFQAFARSAGFDRYYGMDEYDGTSAFDGTWAIWDEEFLQYMGRTLSSQPEPFFSSVFTASSHHPFRVPKQYENRFPQGNIPIHPCIGYTDHALQKFFDYAKKQPWYEHTLFVLTADHTNQLIERESQTAYGIFEVPILFYYPGITPRVDSTTVISQTDIMPSVLAAVGYDKPYFAFGEDALTQGKKHNYVICYNAPVYQILTDSMLVQYDGEEVIAMYNYVKDPLLTQPKYRYEEDMMSYLKAYIQQYVNRMMDNRLQVIGDR